MKDTRGKPNEQLLPKFRKSLSSELATGVRNWRQIVVFDFEPLGSNKQKM